MSWIITYTGQRFDLLAHHLDLWPCLAGIPPLFPPHGIHPWETGHASRMFQKRFPGADPDVSGNR